MSAKGKLEALGQGLTFGWGDELGAGGQEILARLFTDAKPGETYHQARSENRANLAAERKDNPVSAGALEIAGSVPTGILTGPAGAMAQGGAYAVGASDSENPVETVQAGALGALGGKAASHLMGAAGRAVPALTRQLPRPVLQLAQRLAERARFAGMDALEGLEQAGLRGVKGLRAGRPGDTQAQIMRTADDFMAQQDQRLTQNPALWKSGGQDPIGPSGLPIITATKPVPLPNSPPPRTPTASSEAATNPGQRLAPPVPKEPAAAGEKSVEDLLAGLLDPTWPGRKR